MSFKIKPTGDRVIIKRMVEPETITPGGIVIPENARATSQEGTIVAISNKLTEALAVGDRVLFGKYAGAELTVDNQKYVIMREDEILGIIAVEAKTAQR